MEKEKNKSLINGDIDCTGICETCTAACSIGIGSGNLKDTLSEEGCDAEHEEGHDCMAGTEFNCTIAVPLDGDDIAGKFSDCRKFKVYQAKETDIVESHVIDAPDLSQGSIPGFLLEDEIEIVLCDNIGGETMNMMTKCDILVLPGARGNADEAVGKLLRAELVLEEKEPDEHDWKPACGTDCGAGSD